MPERPPKEWWDKTVLALERESDVDNPEKVAGWMWRYWLKPRTRRAILAREHDPKRRLLDPKPNPHLKPMTSQMLYDPQRFPNSEDFTGYAQAGGPPLNIVRTVHQVPEPQGGFSDLIEVMVTLPNNVFDRLKKKFDDEKWEDLEYDEKEGMIIRRGATNRATNVFIQREHTKTG